MWLQEDCKDFYLGDTQENCAECRCRASPVISGETLAKGEDIGRALGVYVCMYVYVDTYLCIRFIGGEGCERLLCSLAK